MSPTQSASSSTSSSTAATQPVVGSRRVQTAVLPDLRSMFADLAEKNPRPVPYLHAAMRAAVVHHKYLGFSLNGRVGAETLGDFACVGSLTADEQLYLRQIANQAAVSGHTESSMRVTGPFTVGAHRAFLVTVPLSSAAREELTACACLAISARSDSEVQLRAFEAQASLLLAVQSIPQSQQPDAKQPLDESLQMAARVSRYGDTREFAFALVNSVASRFDCEQVALGFARGENVAVWAVSGTETFKPSSPGIIDIQQAMEEARDALQTLVYQPEGQSPKLKSLPIHTRWGGKSQSAVCSVPLMAGDKCIAVVSLRRHRRVGFTEPNVAELENLLKPFGAAIEMSLRGDRTLKTHFREASKTVVAAVRNPQTRAGRIARRVAIAAAVILIFGWFPYRPLTPCVLVPGNLTQTLAAFDMQLREVNVRSGDRVARGQVLAVFDTRQLELERAGLTSQLEQAEVDVRKALVNHDAASASLAKANSQVFAAQLASVEKKISQCTIVAPADGMVMQAELNRKLGQVFAQGSPILSFAPLDKWQLEIRIPEYQARYFAAQQSGSFAPASNPARGLNYTITNISGAAELIDGKNVFVATAEVDGEADFFRQGMEGTARTHTGWKPIPWILLHRVVEYARAGFWM